ncbi:MAG: hypothetical protein RLZZ350_1717 [Verrucomicrobiota bacterium]
MKHFLLLFALAFASLVSAQTTLEQDWQNPPRDARLRAYWWWLNGNVDQAAITRDLTEMKAKGFGGALICDAGGAEQDGNAKVPHGPTFFSPAWRELFKHTLREADRLGLELSLNIQSGWNLGGPMVTKEDAPKKLSWSETRVTGGTNLSLKLAAPARRDNFYRDLFVLACPVRPIPASRQPLQNQREKALLTALKPFSAPDSAPLFAEFSTTPGEEDAHTTDVLDLTKLLTADGTLNWSAPAGEWQILRFGYTLNDHCRVSTCSEGWDGYALDPFDAGAFTRYWDAVVEPLIADAGMFTGKTLRYLHTDSWEVEVANWTPTLREEFLKRRGYDLLNWLPVIAGKIVNSRDESDRFLADFRRTMGDLAIDNHYKIFRDRAHAHGLLIHPESGGPHAVPIDAQQCLGMDDAPMSEFWAWSWTHRIGDENRFFVKQPASAAHTYGHKLTLAEGFTTIGPHWQETLWDNLKPTFDHALTEGLNLLVWHAFVCSPASEGIPGQQYFAGTHLNPNVTWWEKSAPFFAYINRCQAMLQRGLPVADVAYYYGDGVPNFAQLRKSDPVKLGAGYDYDVVTADVILNRMSVRDGKIVLPDGVSYRALVLVEREVILPAVLRKLNELVNAGATVIGSMPKKSSSLQNFPQADADILKLADDLWGGKIGRGRVVNFHTARELLTADGVLPDFDARSRGHQSAQTDSASGQRRLTSATTNDGDDAPLALDFIHRRDGDTEIYFVANRATNAMTAACTFRVSGKVPELWNAVTDEHQVVDEFTERDGRTTVPLEFAPCGSWFVVFKDSTANYTNRSKTEKALQSLIELTGAWTVSFATNWGGPASVTFDSLVSWPTRPEPGIKFYSGTATYKKKFELPDSKLKTKNSKFFLDLGQVCELAEVRVNGKSCGVTWTPPFRVDITAAAQSGTNTLEVEVVNFWPNRIIGDAALPPAQRLTRTNVRKLTAHTPLAKSGLLGPVRVLTQP